MNIEKTFKYEVGGIGGVTFDGESIWFTTFSDGELYNLMRINRDDGSIIRQFELDELMSGITWDGSHIWGVTKTGIKRLSPETSQVIQTIPLPDEWFISGLTWDGKYLWAGAHNQRKFIKLIL